VPRAHCEKGCVRRVSATPLEFVSRPSKEKGTHVASSPVRGHLASVELVGEAALDGEAGERSGAERSPVRVDAANSGDEEVGVGEVELRVERHGHDWVQESQPCAQGRGRGGEGGGGGGGDALVVAALISASPVVMMHTSRLRSQLMVGKSGDAPLNGYSTSSGSSSAPSCSHTSRSGVNIEIIMTFGLIVTSFLTSSCAGATATGAGAASAEPARAREASDLSVRSMAAGAAALGGVEGGGRRDERAREKAVVEQEDEDSERAAASPMRRRPRKSDGGGAALSRAGREGQVRRTPTR